MRRFARLATTAAVVVSAALATVSAQTPKAGRKLISYEQAFPAPPDAGGEPRQDESGILADLPSVSGWLDGSTYLETRIDPSDKRRRVYAVNAADGTARVHRDDAALAAALPRDFELRSATAHSNGTSFLWLRDDDLYHFDAATRVFLRLTVSASKEKHPRFSPDAKAIAYTRDNDLYVYDLASRLERQLTSDGSDTILNGDPSWVYMEEIIGRNSNAFWWSPDSTRLVFMRFDDSPVPTFPIFHADGQHGRLEIQRYPKAGDPNPWVKMGVVSVADGRTVWLDFEEKVDHYIAWPFWTPDSRRLLVQWMNRGQDTIRIFDCDPGTGRKKQIFEEKQASWVEWFESLQFLDDGSFLILSNADGWEHVYHHNIDGSLRRRLTSGKWRVNSIVRINETGGWVYMIGRPGKSWDAHVLRVRLDGTGSVELLTKVEGVHRAQVSPDGSYFIDTTSTATTPSSMALYRSDGTLVRKLGSAASEAMSEYAWGKAELFTIPSADGKYQLPAVWVLPPDFSPARQYPVVFGIYGGPDAGRVHNSWQGLQPHYWAQRGVITISVDHRGSGHFGKEGVALMHRQLGKWEMTDLITAAKWLRSKPFVAKDKIAITGGSYGGYATTMALTYGAEHFNFGVASASVTDWMLYDTVYTERYMDTPAENPEGYRQGAVLTWIDRYRGGLRLTHGTIDDNVHLQNTLHVVDWLTSNNKRFELMLYPDSRHGVQSSQRPHATRETHDFWVRNLLNGKLPTAPEDKKKPAAAVPTASH
jgi:dipeptidyl-peptidase-4